MEEKEKNIDIYTDGCSKGNPGPAGIGVLICGSKGKILFRYAKKIGKTTNNQAEYTAVLKALQWIEENKDILAEKSVINFFLDSSLVVNQLNGNFKIKNSNLKEKIILIKKIEKKIPAIIFYKFIPRNKNKEADKLVNSLFK